MSASLFCLKHMCHAVPDPPHPTPHYLLSVPGGDITGSFTFSTRAVGTDHLPAFAVEQWETDTHSGAVPFSKTLTPAHHAVG